jgi:hypothetical protein
MMIIATSRPIVKPKTVQRMKTMTLPGSTIEAIPTPRRVGIVRPRRAQPTAALSFLAVAA